MNYNKKQLTSLLHRHFLIHEWHMNDQGQVDVPGLVQMQTPMAQLPVKFGTVKDFDCDDMMLRSLTGAPHTVQANFTCRKNQLQSLEGAPHHVEFTLMCDGNPLKSLKGLPKHVGSEVILTWNDQLPLMQLFFLKPKLGIELMGAPPEVADLFNAQKHPELYGGGRQAIIKAVPILIKAGYSKNARM
jgi:hypothetical protein